MEPALVKLAGEGCGHCHEPGACSGLRLSRIFGADAPAQHWPNPGNCKSARRWSRNYWPGTAAQRLARLSVAFVRTFHWCGDWCCGGRRVWLDDRSGRRPCGHTGRTARAFEIVAACRIVAVVRRVIAGARCPENVTRLWAKSVIILGKCARIRPSAGVARVPGGALFYSGGDAAMVMSNAFAIYP